MRCRRFAMAGVLAGVAALALSGTARVKAQAPAQASDGFVPPKSSYVPPKTPWGDPDLQGVYDYQSLLNIERPKAMGDKHYLSDADYETFVKGPLIRSNAKTADGCGTGTRKNEVCSEKDKSAVTAYNEFWNTRNFVVDKRTALIEDPPDGRLPPMTPEAEARRTEILKHYGGDTWDSWEDTHALTRCISSQTPNGPHMYNSGTYLMQTPGWVLIVRERLDTRIIPIDGRPHIGSTIREWNGDSRGHFEGNVLVVDTTNYNDKQLGGGGSGAVVPEGFPFGNFHVTEYFVPVSDKRIDYYATYEDPKTWTRPWTLLLPWEKDPGYQIYEYACNEGNISVGNALRGQRAAEANGTAKPRSARRGSGAE